MFLVDRISFFSFFFNQQLLEHPEVLKAPCCLQAAAEDALLVMSDDSRQWQQAVILPAEGHLAPLLSRLFIMQSVCVGDDSEDERMASGYPSASG